MRLLKLLYIADREMLAESACILGPGDHPFTRQETCVAHNLARAPSLAQHQKVKDLGGLILDGPVSEGVLLRIREGDSLSRKMSMEHYEILDSQGLV